MPVYEFTCPNGHKFERILPVSEQGKPQVCEDHNVESQPIEFNSTSWAWGYNEIHWSAGMNHNPMGMNHAKKPGK